MSEKTVQCPFNSQHVMLESALQRHIIRCMVKHPNYLVCPYNALHRLQNRALLTKHMIECSSKIAMNTVLQSNTYNSAIENATVPYHVDNVRKFNLAEENWDEELQ